MAVKLQYTRSVRVASSMVLALLITATVSSSVRADDAALVQYVTGLEKHKTLRGQKGIPALTQDDIRKIVDGDMVVKKADVNDEGLRYVYAVKIMDIDAATFWLTVIDRPHYAQLSDNITESIISRKFDDHFFTYNVLEAPLVSMRHQVLDVRTNPQIFEASGGKIMEQYWHLVDNVDAEIQHALASPNLKNIKPDYVKDAVTVAHNKGSWYIYPLPDGRTWAESFIINDPGGKVPQWVVNTVSTKATKTTFDSYENWAKQKVAGHITPAHEDLMAPTGVFMPIGDLRTLLQSSLK